MRRVVAATFLASTVLGAYGSALATVYVPGQYRSDGIYIRPHFRASVDEVPGFAQFPSLEQPGEDTSKSEMKLPVMKVAPPPVKEPPAQTR